MLNIQNKSNQKPALSIRCKGTTPLPKAMVFGAVATGSIKPTDADNTQGNINFEVKLSGKCKDIAAIIGKASCTEAIFDANSLMITTIMEIKNTINNG